MADKEKIVTILKACLWFITTFWFCYMSAAMLWNIDKTSWMILVRFNEYNEAFIEIPIWVISTTWLMINGSKITSDYIEEVIETNRFFSHIKNILS